MVWYVSYIYSLPHEYDNNYYYYANNSNANNTKTNNINITTVMIKTY